MHQVRHMWKSKSIFWRSIRQAQSNRTAESTQIQKLRVNKSIKVNPILWKDWNFSPLSLFGSLQLGISVVLDERSLVKSLGFASGFPRMLSIFVYCDSVNYQKYFIVLWKDSILSVFFPYKGRSLVLLSMNEPQNKGDNPDNTQTTPQNTADIITNMALAHEILMDDSFKLQSDLPENS